MNLFKSPTKFITGYRGKPINASRLTKKVVTTEVYATDSDSATTGTDSIDNSIDLERGNDADLVGVVVEAAASSPKRKSPSKGSSSSLLAAKEDSSSSLRPAKKSKDSAGAEGFESVDNDDDNDDFVGSKNAGSDSFGFDGLLASPDMTPDEAVQSAVNVFLGAWENIHETVYENAAAYGEAAMKSKLSLIATLSSAIASGGMTTVGLAALTAAGIISNGTDMNTLGAEIKKLQDDLKLMASKGDAEMILENQAELVKQFDVILAKQDFITEQNVILIEQNKIADAKQDRIIEQQDRIIEQNEIAAAKQDLILESMLPQGFKQRVLP